MQELIDDLGLVKSVSFRSSVGNLTETMLDYSIYAMSSVTECFPMVLLEAISVNLPIVSYDCPNGMRHIIIPNNEGGLLIWERGLNLLVRD